MRFIAHIFARLVVKSEAEGIAEGHESPFHGVGFSLFYRAFMSLPQVAVDTVTRTPSLTGDPASNDASLADVGYPPTGELLFSDLAFLFRNAFDFQCLAGPVIETKDAIGLGYTMPTFDVIDLAPGLGAILDGGRRKLCVERVFLFV